VRNAVTNIQETLPFFFDYDAYRSGVTIHNVSFVKPFMQIREYLLQ
jgi:hypothetical protein